MYLPFLEDRTEEVSSRYLLLDLAVPTQISNITYTDFKIYLFSGNLPGSFPISFLRKLASSSSICLLGFLFSKGFISGTNV